MQQTHSDNNTVWQTMLADGCELTVLSVADSQQAALALSFAAGSHAEPAGYLGMAHFLEHLVFRGSRNFALDDGLMAFIQRKGGHVNAQTQAEHTLFHFQVEAPLFLEALARLVDMLVAPRLEPAMLSSEREVIHEEFKLYCQAPQILLDAALAPCLVARHPLQRFYAGNRDTLRIEEAAFAPALAAFHQAAYLRSRLKIVLLLPQAWPSWQAQVLSALQPLTVLPREQAVSRAPAIQVPSGSVVKLRVPGNQTYLVVHIPINQHGQGLAELVEKMQHALALRIGQTFLAYAEQQGWCSAINVRAAYQAEAQGVLTVQFSNPTTAHTLLLEAFRQWLKQWQTQLRSAEQQAYERQAQANRWLVAEPLRKAQQLLASRWPISDGVSVECLAAMEAVLAAVAEQAFVQVMAGADEVAGRYDQGLPLQIEAVAPPQHLSTVTLRVPQFSFASDFTHDQSSAMQSIAIEHSYLSLCPSVSFPKGIAVCYWGWSLANPQHAAQWLPARLAAVSKLLSYNAVDWQVECTQSHLFIRISGPAEYLPIAVNQLLSALEEPLTDAPLPVSGHFALRCLLQRLPRALAGVVPAAPAPAQISLAAQPQVALWLGAADHAGLLEACYLQRLQTLSGVSPPLAAASGWQQVYDSGTEDALLIVHIPLPARAIVEKDRLRLLNRVFAQHLQTALQRYLREQRGLCYAVFVLPYAQGEHEGLSCAVQSSKVSAAQLLIEIKQCLADYHAALDQHLPTLLAELGLQVQQLVQGALGLERLSQMLFRHWREQRLGLGLAAEIQAAQLVTAEDIQSYAQAIQNQQHWLLLSNQPLAG